MCPAEDDRTWRDGRADGDDTGRQRQNRDSKVQACIDSFTSQHTLPPAGGPNRPPGGGGGGTGPRNDGGGGGCAAIIAQHRNIIRRLNMIGYIRPQVMSSFVKMCFNACIFHI